VNTTIGSSKQTNAIAHICAKAMNALTMRLRGVTSGGGKGGGGSGGGGGGGGGEHVICATASASNRSRRRFSRSHQWRPACLPMREGCC
jgi:hypothetical protein